MYSFPFVHNSRGNVSYDYTYDLAGNLLQKKEYTGAQHGVETLGTPTETISYSYPSTGWKDQLAGYNGQSITYDQIGNPLQYWNGMEFTWANGRQLTGIANGPHTVSCQYDSNSIRTKKTVDGVTTEYFLNGSTVLSQVTGNTQLDFFYDDLGNALGFIRNGTDKYYYIRNLQNDVVGILDASGTQVVEYVYDTWGKLESVTGAMAATIGRENPLRYRGYYYDEETGFYYLQSRYYDPETGRFLNADETVLTGQGITSGNMYAYCGNNPVMYVDPSGCFWLPFIVPAVKTVIKMACMVADVVSGIINNGPSSKKFDTMDEAATDWSKKYKPKSETREKGAIIYKITGKDNKTQYTYGRTYNGYNSNVISGFVMGYTTGLGESAISPRKEMVAFVHSHPKPESEYLHDDFPSKADLFLLNLPGIEEVYVVPYKRCPLTPNLIRATDTAKWDYDGHISEE